MRGPSHTQDLSNLTLREGLKLISPEKGERSIFKVTHH